MSRSRTTDLFNHPVSARAAVACLALAATTLAACTQTHVVLEVGIAGGGGIGGADRGGAGGNGGGSGAPGTGGAGGAGGAVSPGTATTVSSGAYHACAIDTGGALYCWGRNDEGRLGVGDTTDHLSPARVGSDTDWQTVATSESGTLALKRNGSLWAWGANDSGQLGLGDASARTRPARIGTRTDWTAIATRFNHACALAHDGSLWCWGLNKEGQLGQNDENTASTDRSEPTQVGTSRDFVAVDAGDGHTCALRAGGTLWCWGRNSEAELGQGSDMSQQIHHPVQVGTSTDWQAVQSGQSSTCGLRGGAVLCWGAVMTAAIPGAPPMTIVSQPTTIGAPPGAVDVSFNTFGGCALYADSSAVCWGRNAEGQLGQGDMADRTGVVGLGTTGWTRLSAGRFSNCGVRAAHVMCSGDNRSGQLGQGDNQRTTMFVDVPLSP